MEKELEKKLKEEFPTLFKDLYGDMTKTCMHWGVSFEKGWLPLLKETCQKIVDTGKTDAYFRQLKEKFGTLRMYIANGNSEIGKIIDEAEERSAHICETCGKEGPEVETGGDHWLKTLCSDCRG